MKRHTGNLPQFQWSGLSEKDEIGRGAYGSVFVATYGGAEKIVVKKLISSSHSEDQQRLFKEASLLYRINHKNMVKLKKVCVAPPAMMLEYDKKLTSKLYDTPHFP